MAKLRLDVLLVEKGLVENRNKAQALIMAGKIAVDDCIMTKAGMMVSSTAQLVVKEDLPYVSRGGIKLASALKTFTLNPLGLICADVGASTGGFTDVLLQQGAKRVYAIDVGYGQLAWSLRQDERVVVMERVNVRYLTCLPELVNLVVIDASFISLALILSPILNWLTQPASIVALIKPQFEAGREQVGKKGIVRETAVHREVLTKMMQVATSLGLEVLALCPSPITGATGNQEFLVHWGWRQTESKPVDLVTMIEQCLV